MKRGLVVLAVALSLVFSSSIFATEVMPVSEIRPGMKGYGLSVFRGTEPDTFQFEVLGFEYGAHFGAVEPWPIIWVKLSGKPQGFDMNWIGVAQAMSGSPLYIDGKLVGALSCTPDVLDKDPIAGITPAEVMLKRGSGSKAESGKDRYKTLLYFSGIDPEIFKLDQFCRRFNPDYFQLIPCSRTSRTSGGPFTSGLETKKDELRAGSSVNIYLVRGDISLYSYGTITFVDDTSFFAFGHPFLGTGESNLPVYQGEIIYTVANVYASYKMAGADIGEPVGTIREDKFWGIRGEKGKGADMIDVSFLFQNEKGACGETRCQVVKLPDWTPLLLKLIAFHTIRRGFYTQESVAEKGSVTIELKLSFKDSSSMDVGYVKEYANRNLSPLLFGYIMLFDDILGPVSRDVLSELESLKFTVTFSQEQKVLLLEKASLSQGNARPGDTVSVKLSFVSFDSLSRYEVEIPLAIPKAVRKGQEVAVQVRTGIYLDGTEKDKEEDKNGAISNKKIETLIEELGTRSNNLFYIKARFKKEEDSASKDTSETPKVEEKATTIETEGGSRVIVWKETNQEKSLKDGKSKEVTLLLKIVPPVNARIEAYEVLFLQIAGNSDSGETRSRKISMKENIICGSIFGTFLAIVLGFVLAH